MKMKLGKLKMPMKGAPGAMKPEKLGFAEDEAEDMDSDSENEMAGEAQEGENEAEADEAAAEYEDSSELSSIPDEDLLAEIKKRGLSKKMGMPSPAPSNSPSADDSTEF